MVMPLDVKGKSRSGAVASIIGSVIVLQPNPKRVGASIVNIGATIKFVHKSDIALINTGIPLVQFGSYEITHTNPWYGSIAIACANAGEVVCFTEDE